MAEWMRTKSLGGGLYLGRFLDPMYFLTKTISWKPNPPQAGIYSPVDVPIGFVTDLTSVPQPFWSLLRPDGEYTYAAIIHDYLYWTQTVSRPIADDILKFAMQDLGVDGMTIFAIHQAVSLAGGNAWEENRRLKNKGEKRILKVFPVDPKVRWEDYKKNSDVLA